MSTQGYCQPYHKIGKRPKKRNCLFPVTVRKKNRVGRSVKKNFLALFFLVKNVCFMHVFR